MSDLIIRSALLETLEEYVEYDNFDLYQETPLLHLSFEQLEDIICNQPTVEAIPKEKLFEIVERLEKQYGVKGYDEEDVLIAYEQAYIHIDEAIEIVKEVGGVE